MIFDKIKSIKDTLILSPAVGCEECKEERGEDVKMDSTTKWHPRLAAEVTAWECPECGHAVMRDTGDGPEMQTPRHETRGRTRHDGWNRRGEREKLDWRDRP